MADHKRGYPSEADKFEDIPVSPNTDLRRFPERSDGTGTAIRTIPALGLLRVSIDEHSSTPGTYFIGKAAPEALDSAAVWQIKRIVTNSSTAPISYDIAFADGNPFFDNIWSNRQSLSYS